MWHTFGAYEEKTQREDGFGFVLSEVWLCEAFCGREGCCHSEGYRDTSKGIDCSYHEGGAEAQDFAHGAC